MSDSDYGLGVQAFSGFGSDIPPALDWIAASRLGHRFHYIPPALELTDAIRLGSLLPLAHLREVYHLR